MLPKRKIIILETIRVVFIKIIINDDVFSILHKFNGHVLISEMTLFSIKATIS